MLTRLIALFALAGLAACGGGTQEPDPAGPLPVAFDTFAGGRAITDEIATNNTALGPMNPADLRFVGTAVYEGTAEIGSTTGLNAIGIASLTVAFDSDAVSGSATGFVDDTDTPVVGTLDLTDGTFDRNGSAGGDITASVAGRFEGGEYIIQHSSVTGEFYGDAEGIMIGGWVSGLVANELTSYEVTIVTRAAD